MVPEFADGDLVHVDPAASPAPGNVVIARHPYKNLEVIKYVERIDDDHVFLSSPSGDDSRVFGRVPLTSIRGVVTANLTTRTRRSPTS